MGLQPRKQHGNHKKRYLRKRAGIGAWRRMSFYGGRRNCCLTPVIERWVGLALHCLAWRWRCFFLRGSGQELVWLWGTKEFSIPFQSGRAYVLQGRQSTDYYYILQSCALVHDPPNVVTSHLHVRSEVGCVCLTFTAVHWSAAVVKGARQRFFSAPLVRSFGEIALFISGP
jgi:hypothetical protein